MTSKWLSLVALLLISSPAVAQSRNPPANYPTASGNYSAPANTVGYLDTFGNFVPASAANPLPVAAVVTPGGTQDINIKQVQGAVPSATNPLWVAPASADNPWPISAASLPLPAGAALDTSVGTTNTDIGPPGATACSTDTASCSLNALIQRVAQRITSLITALGTPMQTTGGTVGLVAGSAQVGTVSGSNVGGYEFQLSPTVTVQNAAYSAGNSEGGLITVTGAARTNGGGGILDGLRIKSAGASTNTIWVYAWSKTPQATCTDKSAYVGNSADQVYALVGFPASVVLGGAPGAWDTATYATLSSLVSNFKNQDSSPGTAIYVCLVTAGSVTPASTSDLSINFGGIQD